MSTRPLLLDHRLLRSFLVLAEELHYGRAAERLHLTQPPLSKQIVRLEADLGVVLFDRNRRGVRLTPAGQALVGEARRLMFQSEYAIDAVRQAERGDSGRVRVAFNASALFIVGEQMTRLLRQQLPKIQCSWEEMGSSEQALALQQERIDIGLAQTPDLLPGLHSRIFAQVPLVAAMPDGHPLTRKRSVQLAQLAHEDFVVVPREIGPGFFDLLISACMAQGFSPRIVHQVRHQVTAMGIVATSAAVALVPATMARASTPGVTFLRLAGEPIYAKYSIIWNPQNRLPALPELLRVLGQTQPLARWRPAIRDSK